MQGTDSEEYLVVWRTLSADDDEPAIGALHFAVNTNGAAEPTPPTGNGDSSSGGGASPLLVILVGLVGSLLAAPEGTPLRADARHPRSAVLKGEGRIRYAPK